MNLALLHPMSLVLIGYNEAELYRAKKVSLGKSDKIEEIIIK